MPRLKYLNHLGLFAATLVFVAVAVGVLLGAQRFIADAAEVAHTNEVIANIDAVEARLRDAEATHRGYLLTGNVDLLAQYQASRAQVPPLLERLASLVSDNSAQLERVRRLEALVERRLLQMQENQTRYREQGLAVARAAINDESIGTSVRIGESARGLAAVERQLLAERGRSSRRSANILRLLAVLGMPLGIVLVAFVYRTLLGEIRRRDRAERLGSEANQRLLQTVAQLKRQGADLGELTRYGGLLQNCLSPTEAVALSVQVLSRLLPGTGGTLYRIRASRDYAEAVAHWGEHAAASVDMLPPEQCWALRRGQPHLLRADDEGMRCEHIEATVDAGAFGSACIPLVAQGTQLGFLYLSSGTPAFLSQMDLVRTAAEQLSMALHNLSLQERLRIQSIRDPLTGLFNRRYLEESLMRELANCVRHGQPLSVLMLDLDHFKAFNDLHGHAGGDALLASFGQLLGEHAREVDIACRYGGEEFTLILPETGSEAALECAARLGEKVRQMRVHHLGKELPAVTVSIGIARYRGGADDAGHLLRRADEALYRAKREGRDRAACAD
jgi:diguanylate cyclase (GGDEF)-like protein